MADDETTETTETTSRENTETTSTTEDEFDKDRALATIKKQREEEAKAKQEAKELRDRLKAYEDRDKSEQEKAAEKAAEAEKRASTAEAQALRLEVALEKAPEGMSLAQVRKLAKRLAGSTKEELEQDAEELFADFAPQKGEERSGRPKERLRSGAIPDREPERSPQELADAVVAQRGY